MAPDTLYVAVTAWLVYLLVRALQTTGRPSTARAVAAGVLGAGAVLLSYGLALIAVVPACAAIRARRVRPLLVAAGVASAMVLAVGLLGFWWFAGLAATRREYGAVGFDRPYAYFFVNNLSAWALALGPAVAVGFVLLRDRRAWVLAGGGLAAALLANLSGMSEGEVERIWLPFTVWTTVAVVGLGDGRAARGLLALQAASALVVTALIGTYW
jgi:hypothetical protein